MSFRGLGVAGRSVGSSPLWWISGCPRFGVESPGRAAQEAFEVGWSYVYRGVVLSHRQQVAADDFFLAARGVDGSRRRDSRPGHELAFVLDLERCAVGFEEPGGRMSQRDPHSASRSAVLGRRRSSGSRPRCSVTGFRHRSPVSRLRFAGVSNALFPALRSGRSGRAVSRALPDGSPRAVRFWPSACSALHALLIRTPLWRSVAAEPGVLWPAVPALSIASIRPRSLAPRSRRLRSHLRFAAPSSWWVFPALSSALVCASALACGGSSAA